MQCRILCWILKQKEVIQHLISSKKFQFYWGKKSKVCQKTGNNSTGNINILLFSLISLDRSLSLLLIFLKTQTNPNTWLLVFIDFSSHTLIFSIFFSLLTFSFICFPPNPPVELSSLLIQAFMEYVFLSSISHILIKSSWCLVLDTFIFL